MPFYPPNHTARRGRTITAPVVHHKPDVTQRAGSHLTQGAKRTIYGPGQYGRRREHGVLDVALRIYQSGGEQGNFIYRRDDLVTLALPVWQQIATQCDTIEVVDHVLNRCYSLPTARAQGTGTTYNAGIGERIGWPRAWWTVTDAMGVVVQAGQIP